MSFIYRHFTLQSINFSFYFTNEWSFVCSNIGSDCCCREHWWEVFNISISNLTVSNHQYILCDPVFDESGSMFHPDDPLVLRAEGLEKPRKKRGRPKKAQSEPDISTDNSTSNTGYSEIAPVDSETKRDDKHDKDEDPDGRRRRKRKVPQR